MLNNRNTLRWLALTAAILSSAAAHGATVDTFNFNEPNAYQLSPPGGQTLEIAGSFTGTVESDGLIELADLSAFEVQLLDPNGNPIPFDSMGLNLLQLFSFNINGGASSLDFAGVPTPNLSSFCLGAATTLDAACTEDFKFTYPVGTIGAFLSGGQPLASSTSFADVTLVSSVTTPPPTPVPEPRFNFLAGILFVAAGGGLRRFLRRCGTQHARALRL